MDSVSSFSWWAVSLTRPVLFGCFGRFRSLSYTPRLEICFVVRYVGVGSFKKKKYASCAGLVMTDALDDHEGTVNIGGRTITNLRFADDTDGLAGDEEDQAKIV